MAKDTQGKMKIVSPDTGGLGVFSRFLITIFILGFIFLVFIFFAVRREGGRVFIEEMLEKHTGLDLSIKNVRIGFPYDIVIEEIVSDDFNQKNLSGFKVKEIRIGIGVRKFLRITINRSILNLVKKRNGSWEPGCFAKLGDLPWRDLAEISVLTSRIAEKATISIKDSTINWISINDTVASASGITFKLKPAGIPGKKMIYHYLYIYNVLHINNIETHNVEREWLSSEAREYIEISSSKGILPVPVRAFWKSDPGEEQKDD